MTLEINVIQTCNGCGIIRNLTGNRIDEISEILEYGKWRCVKKDKHLCPQCIDNAVN